MTTFQLVTGILGMAAVWFVIGCVLAEHFVDENTSPRRDVATFVFWPAWLPLWCLFKIVKGIWWFARAMMANNWKVGADE